MKCPPRLIENTIVFRFRHGDSRIEPRFLDGNSAGARPLSRIKVDSNHKAPFLGAFFYGSRVAATAR
jgi:hypothetical protein